MRAMLGLTCRHFTMGWASQAHVNHFAKHLPHCGLQVVGLIAAENQGKLPNLETENRGACAVWNRGVAQDALARPWTWASCVPLIGFCHLGQACLTAAHLDDVESLLSHSALRWERMKMVSVAMQTFSFSKQRVMQSDGSRS